MPRAAGQIDLQKNEAILDAAAAVMSERGMAAPIETIAKRAGVSKQTIYNHYGSKVELVRALIARGAAKLTAVFEAEGAVTDVETALANFAMHLLRPSLNSEAVSLLRIIIQAGESNVDLAVQIFALGPQAAISRTARFLEAASAEGHLDTPDPEAAAEAFIGMVLGQRQIKQLLRLPHEPGLRAADQLAREAARRFMRAYAPYDTASAREPQRAAASPWTA